MFIFLFSLNFDVAKINGQSFSGSIHAKGFSLITMKHKLQTTLEICYKLL